MLNQIRYYLICSPEYANVSLIELLNHASDMRTSDSSLMHVIALPKVSLMLQSDSLLCFPHQSRQMEAVAGAGLRNNCGPVN